MELSARLLNGKRQVKDILSKDEMHANLIDRKNLHIIRLFGKEYPRDNEDEVDSEDRMDQAVAMLSCISEVIKRNGIVLIEDFEEKFFSHKELRKAFRYLYRIFFRG